MLDWTVRYWEKAQARRPAGRPRISANFYRDFEWMGLQRHLKVLGIFARLNYRDGKSSYLEDTPRFIGYVRAVAARYAALARCSRCSMKSKIGRPRAPVTHFDRVRATAAPRVIVQRCAERPDRA